MKELPNMNKRNESSVRHRCIAGLLLVGAAAIAGCHNDKPHQYGQERPPVGDLYEGDRGLQSKDVVAASDKMASDLLADPNLNASNEQYTIVVDRVDNQTS